MSQRKAREARRAQEATAAETRRTVASRPLLWAVVAFAVVGVLVGGIVAARGSGPRRRR